MNWLKKFWLLQSIADRFVNRTDKVHLLIRVVCRDGETVENLMTVTSDRVQTVVREMIENEDAREVTIYEQIHHHEKSFVGDGQPDWMAGIVGGVPLATRNLLGGHPSAATV